MEDGAKVEVTKEELGEVLCYWLAQDLSRKGIRQAAKTAGYSTWGSGRREKLRHEWAALNVWLIESVVDAVFRSGEVRGTCMAAVFGFAYAQTNPKPKSPMGEWLDWATERGEQYDEAFRGEHPSGPAWLVATAFLENLKGVAPRGLAEQLKLMGHLALSMEHLSSALQRYDVT